MEQSNFWQPASDRGNWGFHFPFLWLYICPLSGLCVACSALHLQGRATRAHLQQVRTLLQEQCLHSNFGCLSCTSSYSTFEVSTSAHSHLNCNQKQQPSWDSAGTPRGEGAPRQGTGTTNPMRPLTPRARSTVATDHTACTGVLFPSTAWMARQETAAYTKLGETRTGGYGKGD